MAYRSTTSWLSTGSNCGLYAIRSNSSAPLGSPRRWVFFRLPITTTWLKRIRLQMHQSEDADTVKLAGQEPGACAHEHQHPLAGHPAITMFQEHQLHPLIT